MKSGSNDVLTRAQKKGESVKLFLASKTDPFLASPRRNFFYRVKPMLASEMSPFLASKTDPFLASPATFLHHAKPILASEMSPFRASKTDPFLASPPPHFFITRSQFWLQKMNPFLAPQMLHFCWSALLDFWPLYALRLALWV